MLQLKPAIGRLMFVAAIVLSLCGSARAHVIVLAPNGGEEVGVGSVVTISWRIAIAHNTQNWDLWYSTTSPNGPWNTIAMNLPPGDISVNSIHTYDWTIPDTQSDQCYVRVRMDNTGTDYEDVSDSSFAIIAKSVDVTASEYNVINGEHLEGKLSDSFDSDDSYLKFNPSVPLVGKEAPLWLEFSGTSPSETPNAISLVLETNNNTPNTFLLLEAFNYDSGEFEIGTFEFPNSSDSSIEVLLTGDIARFVEDGTSKMKIKVTWRPIGPVLFYPWTISIDQVSWSVIE